jgi:hypothetical protein
LVFSFAHPQIFSGAKTIEVDTHITEEHARDLLAYWMALIYNQ